MDPLATSWEPYSRATEPILDSVISGGCPTPFRVPSPHIALSSKNALNLNGQIRYKDLLFNAIRLQRTLTAAVVVEGFGFWTSEDIRVEFRPAPANSGLVFVRSDLEGEPRIPVATRFRIDKPRQTSLASGSAQVDMIEHLLAALAALRIDNCEIWVDRAEMPGLDGSAGPFFDALKKAGSSVQAAIRPLRVVLEPFRIGSGQTYIDVSPSENASATFHYRLEYGGGCAIGTQEHEFNTLRDSFEKDIAHCRTFLAKKEADALLAMGLCRRVTTKNVLVFDERGPIENELLFANECARHKVLDMVGDFSLAPVDWLGCFKGHFSGHRLNADCVDRLMQRTLLLDETSLEPNDKRLLQIQSEREA